jgi:hypothetical protein
MLLAFPLNCWKSGHQASDRNRDYGRGTRTHCRKGFGHDRRDSSTATRENLTPRNQLSLVKAEIGRIVAVLRSMGLMPSKASKTNWCGLRASGRIRAADQLTRKPNDARRPGDGNSQEFHREVERGWANFSPPLTAISGVRFSSTSSKSSKFSQPTKRRAGTYKLRLFPEVAAQPVKNRRIIPPAPECENGDPVLTESPFVRELDDQAPRIGRFSNFFEKARRDRTSEVVIRTPVAEFKSYSMGCARTGPFRTWNPLRRGGRARANRERTQSAATSSSS